MSTEHENLPVWSGLPELQRREVLQIPANAGPDWCDMANFFYARRNYQTEVDATFYRRPKYTQDGRPIPAAYESVEWRNNSGALELHTLQGIFIDIEMRNELNRGGAHLPLIRIPYLRMAGAHDLESGWPLTGTAQQQVLVPLSHMYQLRLEQQ